MTDTQHHYCIVGGGIMGAAALYYLVQHPVLESQSAAATITLVEAASSLAPAASGKAGGFLAQDWHGPATASIADLSFRLHRQLAQEQGGKDKWGYRDVETYSLNYDDAKGAPAKKRSAPAGLDWVDVSRVTSTSRLGGQGTTAQVTPLRLVQHLVAEAEAEAAKRGVTVDVKLNTMARGAELDEAGEKVQGLVVAPTATGSGHDEAGRTTIPCTRLILAAGPWLGSLVTSMFPRSFVTSHRFLHSASYVDGSRAHSIVVRGSRPASNHCLFTDMSYGSGSRHRKAAAPEVYARGDGTVYVCGGSDDEPLPALAEDVTYDSQKTEALIEQTSVLSPEVLSSQAGAKVEKQQACYLPVPHRGNFIVAGSAASGVYVGGGGGSCWGITMSLGAGKCISEIVLDGKATSADVGQLQG
ncbi:unnamed protein product [Parajaminaea phylloscopi]